MERFTFVEKSVYVCGRFMLVGGFTFDGVTTVSHIKLIKKIQISKISKKYQMCTGLLIGTRTKGNAREEYICMETDNERCPRAVFWGQHSLSYISIIYQIQLYLSLNYSFDDTKNYAK